MIYLYLKEHRITGMKYLGKTERDPYEYKGSGTYWIEHLRKHGNIVDTKILGTYQTNEEVRDAGRYYSTLWDIVESDEWANLIPESGDGGGAWNKGMIYDEEMKQRLSVPHPKAQGKQQTEKHIEARKKALKGRAAGFKDKTHTNKTKQAQREAALNREKKECPHCHKIVAINTYSRWHEDNCKKK